ncbi:MAG: hypothetical protein GQ574_27290 [Crocinitomix sp.]|nr:hypothetical protein [Crocinitomix sp.]
METKIENLDNSGTIITNSSIQAENINTGDHNTYINNITNPSFSEIDFEHEEVYPNPVFSEFVFEELSKKRILIIKGNDQFDHFSFGRSIAKQLGENKPDHKIIELIQNEEDVALNGQLMQLDCSQIILLNALHPRHIQYDFNQLIRISEAKQSYFIINTATPQSTWLKSGKIISEYWFDVPESGHYKKADLIPWFISKIHDQALPIFADLDEINEGTKFSDNQTLSTLMESLSTPQKLTIFLNNCRSTQTLFTDKKLEQIITNLSQSQEEIETKWFNNLNPEQKIIALTAALFNGLFCNQYFEIIGHMIESTFWKQSGRTLEALDYHNLEFLTAFFRFETTDEGDLIVARNPATRVNLLRTAVHQFPRHIEKALSVFSGLMQESYKRKHTNWDLHGTTQKRALLRQVFIETTRDIGINELANIESIYLELAASEHDFIQGIAAKSLAQYRLYEEDELLFETINKWLKSDSIKKRIALFLNKNNSKKRDNVSAIKATTVRILAYAADYDQPNKLHKDIIEFLITFATDYSSKVQESVAKVLPKFIVHHTFQLRNEIFDSLMPNPNYTQAISEGLMNGYKDYPDTLKEVINHWLSICMQQHSEDNRRKKTTHRDNALISIINTLEKIEITNKGFSLKELYDIAVELLRTEKRGDVVRANLNFLAHLQQQNYAMAYDYVSETIGLFTRDHRKILVKSWTLQFLIQRKDLTDGQFYITVHGTEYPAWGKMLNRPLTALEETLFTWLNSTSKPAQKFATLTFLDIAHSFEKEEHDQIQAYAVEVEQRKIRWLENQRSQTNKVRLQTPSSAGNVGFGLWLRIKIFFYLLFEDKETKETLKGIIHAFLAEPYSKKDLNFVIYKWKTRQKGNLSSKLAKWLGKLMRNI